MAAWSIADTCSAGRQQHMFSAGAAVVAVVLGTCAAKRCRLGCRAGNSAGDRSPPSQCLSPAVPTPVCTHIQDTHIPARHLRLSGSAAERGRLLGKELRNEVKEVLTAWRLELHSRFAIDNPAAESDDAAVQSWARDFAASFLAAEEYSSIATLDRWVPQVREELREVAENAGVSYEELLCMQHRAECDRYGASTYGGYVRREEITTSMAVCGVRKLGLPALIAQSVEFEPSRCRHEMILEMVAGPAAGGPPSPPTLFLAHAGMIAPLSGVNGRGIAVVADLLPQLACSIGGGICAGFAVRAALAQSSFEDAIHMLLEMPHASGCCFTIGGPDGRVAVIEASGRGPPLMLLPPKPGSFTVHTNHPLENDDVDSQEHVPNRSGADTHGAGNVQPRGWDSSARLARMQEYLAVELSPLIPQGDFVSVLEKTGDALVRAVAFSPAKGDLRTFGLAVLVCDAEQPRLECTTSEFETFVRHTFSQSI